MRQTDGMTGQLWMVSIAIALYYFGVSIYHFWRASGVEPAVIAEAILGLVMTAGIVGVIRSPLLTYILMLAGIALGFALILGPRGRTRSI
jgi:hypothetical protein